MPITTFLQRFKGSSYSLGIMVESESADVYSETLDEVIGILRTLRKVSPGDENDFEITTNDELMETFGSFTGSIKIFAFPISLIALIVAGIGIMNIIMLVSVTERIKEIGVRKAIGATKRHILIQFLTEAVFLCQVGGIIGVIFGIAAGSLISIVAKVPAVIPIDWAVYGVISCSLIIGFGSYPAWRAANLDRLIQCGLNNSTRNHCCSYSTVLIN